MLKVVLEPLCLGSRYRLFENNGGARRALRLAPILCTHVLPHCICHRLGSSLIQPQLLYKFIVRITGTATPRVHKTSYRI
jgi:hypothetical protein